MKICRKCSQEKPLIAFSRNKSFPDGKSTWCKQCRSEYRRDEYAAHNPERQRVSTESVVERRTKVCIDCMQELTSGLFDRKRSAKDGLTSYCKECGKARSVKWQRENKDKIAYKRWEYRKSSPRWSLGSNLKGALARRPTDNPASIDDVMAMWDGQEGKCALTGIPMTWAQGKVTSTSITIDRVDWEKGYSVDNIRLICHAINSFRGRMSDEEMLAMARTLIAKADDSEPSWRNFNYYTDGHIEMVN